MPPTIQLCQRLMLATLIRHYLNDTGVLHPQLSLRVPVWARCDFLFSSGVLYVAITSMKVSGHLRNSLPIKNVRMCVYTSYLPAKDIHYLEQI